MTDRLATSPLATYNSYLAEGKLAYQFDESAQRAVFYPRVIAPETGNDLTWRVSQGLGAVYATTVLFPKGQPAYNVALVEMDEGYRLMSRVDNLAPEQVRIGMRVRARIHEAEGDAAPYPVFDLVETA